MLLIYKMTEHSCRFKRNDGKKPLKIIQCIALIYFFNILSSLCVGTMYNAHNSSLFTSHLDRRFSVK